MKKTIIAIDPGASGATAILHEDGSVKVFKFTSESDFCELIKETASDGGFEVFLEKVGGFTGQGQPGSAMFKFGRNFGFILGVLSALGFPIRLVTPQAWQKGHPATPKLANRSEAQRRHKNDLKDVAARLFPKIKVTLANADALLILDYAIRQQQQR